MFSNKVFDQNYNVTSYIYEDWIPIYEFFKYKGRLGYTYNSNFKYKGLLSQLASFLSGEQQTKDTIKAKVEEYLKPIETKTVTISWNYSRYSSVNLNNSFNREIRSTKIVSDLLYLEVDNVPMIAFVVPREQERYFKLCFLYDEWPDISQCRLLVDERMKSTGIPSGLKKRFKSYILPHFAKYDLQPEYVKSISKELYWSPKFNFKTLSEKKEYFQKIYKTVQHEQGIWN